MAQEFNISVDRWSEKVKGRMERFMREFAQDLAQRIVTETPVDTGFLRSSWWLSLNDPSAPDNAGEEFSGGKQARENGASAKALSTINLRVQDYKIGQTIYIVNGARYARRMENHPNGGMVAKATQDATQIGDAAALRVARAR